MEGPRRKRTREDLRREVGAKVDTLYDWYHPPDHEVGGVVGAVKRALTMFGYSDGDAPPRINIHPEEEQALVQSTISGLGGDIRAGVTTFFEEHPETSLDGRRKLLRYEGVALYEELRSIDPDLAIYDCAGGATVHPITRKMVQILDMIETTHGTLTRCMVHSMKSYHQYDPLYARGGLEAMQRSILAPVRVTEDDDERHTQYQRLLFYLFDELSAAGYRRCGGTNNMAYCFQRVYTPAGEFTYAWESAMSISEFINDRCSAQGHHEMYLNITAHPDNFRHAIKHISEWNDCRFPELDKDRTVFSFKNGVYLCDTNTFHEYSDGPLVPPPVAAKFFDLEFDPDWTDPDLPPEEIPTPAYDRILRDQRFSPEVQTWHWVMAGRMIYPIKSKDGWEVMPFHKGLANTGKSTIINEVISNLYVDQDVGTIANNTETKFGLSPIANAKIAVAVDIKGDFSLEQATWQSMVTGERVSLAVKHKNPVFMKWRAGCVFAGNEVPGFRDKQGSVARRFLVFLYHRRVDRVDTTLGAKLRGEMAAIIVKANRIYRTMAEKHQGKGIWDQGVLPEYFHKSRLSVQAETNPLVAFLCSDVLVRGENKFIPLARFRESFFEFCDERSIRKPRWSPDLWRGPFGRFHLKNKRATRVWRNVRRAGQQFVMGCDLSDEQVSEGVPPPPSPRPSTSGSGPDADAQRWINAGCS